MVGSTPRTAPIRFVLRNVFTRLANEGLLELQPNRSARVREITVAEAIEITEIRRAAEGFVAARAAERITDDEVVDVKALGAEMAAAVERADMVLYSELNARPEHLAIVDALCSRDPDRAERAMRVHLTSVLAAFTPPTS